LDRKGINAITAIVAIAALLVIASIIYPYAKEWWESRESTPPPSSPPPSGEPPTSDSGITSIRAIVENPSGYANRKVMVVGTFGQATFYYLEEQGSVIYLDASLNFEILQKVINLQKGARYKAVGVVFYSPQQVNAVILMLENIWPA
jgi:hypothetical protein